jgi:integrase
MTKSKSTKKKTADKPAKPYPEFPLFPHDTKRWAKKILNKTHYFGPWNDPQGALQKFLDQKDDLYAGRTPRRSTEGVTIRDVCNRFLAVKEHMVDTGELSPRTYRDYKDTVIRICGVLDRYRPANDLRSEDFEQLRMSLAKTRGTVSLGNEIQRVRVIFRYAYDAGLIEKPICFGPAFRRPTRKTLRKVRQSKPPLMFAAAELQQLLNASEGQLRAMILLGINCGFGNNDCGTLPVSALDLEAGWVDFPRPKTGIQRRCPLWPETVQAIQSAIECRPAPKDEADGNRVFITKYGKPWAKDTPDSPISKETTKLLKELKLHRPQLGFYALRHTFATIAGDSRDQVAVDSIMGHAPPEDDMASRYRERISDERLVAVSNHVRQWLFAGQADGAKRSVAAKTRPTTASKQA